MRTLNLFLALMLGVALSGFSQTSCIEDGVRYNLHDALTERNWGFWLPDFYGPGTGYSHFSFDLVTEHESYLDVFNDGTAHLHGVVAQDNKPFDRNGELWGFEVWLDPHPEGAPKGSTSPIDPAIMATWDLYKIRDGESKMWLLSDSTVETQILFKTNNEPFGFQIGEYASLYDHLCDDCPTLGASTWLDFTNQWNDGKMSGAVHMTLTECESEECEVDHRTQTPGGWGAKPNGENPGTYLHANFDSAFPNGLVVGCDHTITFTSAQAITDFLPAGGKPAALRSSYTDPVSGGNSLASHVIALSLSVGLDAHDTDFSGSGTPLSDLVAISGMFSGWTVGEILAEGNRILGGCVSDYSASDITDALTMINENFVDGFVTGKYLACKGSGAVASVEVKAFPNPIESMVTVEMSSMAGSKFKLKVFNSYGEDVLEVEGKFNSEGKFSFDASSLDQGGYIITINTGRTVKTVKVFKN